MRLNLQQSIIQPTKCSGSIIACAVALLVSVEAAQAATIVAPTGASVSSVSAGGGAGFAIDGSGFSAAEQATLETGDPVPVSWPDSDVSPWNKTWRTWVGGESPISTNEWIELDLGGDYSLTGMHFWNYIESSFQDRGSETINVLLSDDGGASFAITAVSGYNVDRYIDDTSNVPLGQTIVFGATYHNIDTVRIEVAEAVGYAGVGEVRFTAVPEPSSYALLAGCFGLTWVMLRRRR